MNSTTSSLLASLRSICLSVSLLSPDCWDSLVQNMNLGDTGCLKMLLSRSLGLAIILGATCVKLPQIYKIVKNGSAEGISFVGTLLELMAVTANGAYSFSRAFPFTAYGEAISLSLQTSLVALLVLWYGGNTISTVLFSVLYGITVFAITSPGLVPDQVLWYGQAANIPMIVLGKLVQVWANAKQGHTGQLSAITIFLLTLGSIARVFTSIQETGDPVVICTYICSSAVNIMLAGQVVFYWSVEEEKEKLKQQQRTHKKVDMKNKKRA